MVAGSRYSKDFYSQGNTLDLLIIRNEDSGTIEIAVHDVIQLSVRSS